MSEGLLNSLPRPRPDMQAYEDEFEAALNRAGDVRANHERFRSHERAAILDYMPVKMDFENVSRCNFRCGHCQVSGWTGGRRGDDMALADFESVLDSLSGLVEIKLQGIGEPLLGGESFFEMIRMAREKHIWVRTTTNASLLHVNDNYAKLIDADPSEVQISIDGATADVMEGIRKGSNFVQVSENCRSINDYAASKGLLKTRMWVCLQRDNFAQFHDLVRHADALGFRRLSFALNLHGWGMEEFIERNAGKCLDDGEVFEKAQGALALGDELGVDVSFWSNVDKYDASEKKTLCPWPFERAFVSSDLKVVPCCMISNPDILNFGDARDFETVWHGDAYRAFRQAHLDGNIPTPCRSCYNLV